jgi:hypothetical protein
VKREPRGRCEKSPSQMKGIKLREGEDNDRDREIIRIIFPPPLLTSPPLIHSSPPLSTSEEKSLAS